MANYSCLMDSANKLDTLQKKVFEMIAHHNEVVSLRDFQSKIETIHNTLVTAFRNLHDKTLNNRSLPSSNLISLTSNLNKLIDELNEQLSPDAEITQLDNKLDDFNDLFVNILYEIQKTEFDLVYNFYKENYKLKANESSLSQQNNVLKNDNFVYIGTLKENKITIEELTGELERIKAESAKNLSKELTQKFSERAKEINKNKYIMSIFLFLTSIITIAITIFTIFPELLSNTCPFLSIKDNSSEALFFFKRTTLLVFSYVILFFIMKQYNREREIEESYRFKEAVASSIQSYRDIATEPIVKDKLIEESARVIFEHPHERKQKVRTETKEPDLIESLNVVQKASDIIKSFNKAD